MRQRNRDLSSRHLVVTNPGFKRDFGSRSWLSRWMFPKMVGFPPKSSIWVGFSIINHPFWGTPDFWKHPGRIFFGGWVGKRMLLSAESLPQKFGFQVGLEINDTTHWSWQTEWPYITRVVSCSLTETNTCPTHENGIAENELVCEKRWSHLFWETAIFLKVLHFFKGRNALEVAHRIPAKSYNLHVFTYWDVPDYNPNISRLDVSPLNRWFITQLTNDRYDQFHKTP